MATDGRSRTANATLTVDITLDEQPPYWRNLPYIPGTVSENAANLSGVYTITAVDPDLKVRPKTLWGMGSSGFINIIFSTVELISFPPVYTEGIGTYIAVHSMYVYTSKFWIQPSISSNGFLTMVVACYVLLPQVHNKLFSCYENVYCRDICNEKLLSKVKPLAVLHAKYPMIMYSISKQNTSHANSDGKIKFTYFLKSINVYVMQNVDHMFLWFSGRTSVRERRVLPRTLLLPCGA